MGELSAGRRLGWRRALLISAPAALLGASLGLGKIVRDCSLTCTVGFELAPFAIIAVALATAPLSALRARLEGRWGYQRWHIGSTLAAAASFLLFRLVTHGLQAAAYRGPPGEAAPWFLAVRWTYLAFFVWLGTVTVVLGANAFAHAYTLPSRQERERGVEAVAASAVFGALAGSWIAGRTASWLMASRGWPYETVRDSLMLGMAAVLLLKLPLVVAIDRARLRRGTEGVPAVTPSPSVVRGTLGRALRSIGRDPRLRSIGALVLIGGIADTVITYLFYWLVTEQVSALNGRTLFFAGFHAWVNAGSLLMLAFGTGRLIRRLGLLFALLSLPVALTLGATALAFSLILIVGYVLRVVESAFRSSLYEPGIERLYLETDQERVRLVRPVLSGLAVRAGEGLGAVLVLMLTFGLAVSLRQLLGLYLVLLAAWIAAVVWSRRAWGVRS